jgi:RNA polymerase sigma factor (sigma-70 family)
VPKHEAITSMLAERRKELVNYAGVVSGDTAGAEDLVQEAWLRFDRAAQSHTVSKPLHLLWRILRNLSIDRGRRLAHERRVVISGRDEGLLAGQPDDQPSVEDMLIARDELVRIQRLLDSFDPATRIALEMHRFEGARLREIAAHLGISLTSAHGLVTTAVRQIRDALGQDF